MSTNAAARIYRQITPADGVQFPEGVCRTILCNVPGTANLVQPDGTEREGYPLQQGYNPVQCIGIEEGGDADEIWGLWGG